MPKFPFKVLTKCEVGETFNFAVGLRVDFEVLKVTFILEIALPLLRRVIDQAL